MGDDVFHTKREGGYWGLGLVEVVWKVCAAVANCQMKWSVTLNDAFYKLRAGGGEGTATLEAKLVQQLVGIAHEPLFQVFLDVRKVYKSMDRVRCTEIMRGYGMVQNMARPIAHH